VGKLSGGKPKKYRGLTILNSESLVFCLVGDGWGGDGDHQAMALESSHWEIPRSRPKVLSMRKGEGTQIPPMWLHLGLNGTERSGVRLGGNDSIFMKRVFFLGRLTPREKWPQARV